MSSILTVFAFIFSQDTLCTSKASHSKFSIQETCARAFDKEGFELAIRFMQMFEKQKSILRNRQTKFCHHTLERVSPDVNRAKPVFNVGGLMRLNDFARPVAKIFVWLPSTTNPQPITVLFSTNRISLEVSSVNTDFPI